MIERSFKYHIIASRDFNHISEWIRNEQIHRSEWDVRITLLDESMPQSLADRVLVLVYMFDDERIAVTFKLRFG